MPRGAHGEGLARRDCGTNFQRLLGPLTHKVSGILMFCTPLVALYSPRQGAANCMQGGEDGLWTLKCIAEGITFVRV